MKNAHFHEVDLKSLLKKDVLIKQLLGLERLS